MYSNDLSGYSLSDFLEDDTFVQWVLNPTREGDVFWNSFLRDHADKKEIVEKAISIIRVYRKQDKFHNEFRKGIVWNRIQDTIKAVEEVPAPGSVIPLYRKIAAAVALVAVSGFVLWFYLARSTTVTTAYGEIKTVILPDKSTVILNANSSLTYSNEWDDDEKREVWLRGEAYFDVIHLNKDTLRISPADQFMVHSEDIDIEVLGTRFNVKSRKNRTNVALLTGKIKLHFPDKASDPIKDIVMIPGEYVEYQDNKLKSHVKLEKPRNVTAWMKHEFIFTDARLLDIIQTLREDHGYTVDVRDQRLMNLKIEGEISVTTIQELFETIEVALDLSIEESNKHIIIDRK